MTRYIITIEFPPESSDLLQDMRDCLSLHGAIVPITSHAMLYQSELRPIDIRAIVFESDAVISSLFVCEMSAPAAWKGLSNDNDNIKRFFSNEL